MGEVTPQDVDSHTKKIACPTLPLACVLHYAIHRPEKGLDIQSDWIFVSITKDLLQE